MSWQIVKFLLEMGANPNLEDPEGNSAADLTIEKDIREVNAMDLCHSHSRNPALSTLRGKRKREKRRVCAQLCCCFLIL